MSRGGYLCCLYTVYDERTDKPVAIDATSACAARRMGITVQGLQQIHCRGSAKWWVQIRKVKRAEWEARKAEEEQWNL